MRHALIAAALLIAFSAGVTLAQTGTIAFTPLPTAATPPASARATVERFYQAINTTLATGDSTELAQVIAPEFLDAAPPPGITPDRAGFLAYLQSVRQTRPALRLSPTEAVVGATGVATFVHVTGAEREDAALLRPTGALWPPIDILQVSSEQITRRDSGNTGQSWVASLLTTTTAALSGPGRQVVSLNRETYRQETDEWQVVSGPTLLLAESGALSATLGQSEAAPATLIPAGKAPTSLAAPAHVTLAPGDALALSAKSRYRAESATDDPATALTVRIVPLIYAPGFDQRTHLASLATPSAEHPDQLTLAGGMAVRLLLPAVTIALEQIALMPGTELPSHTVVGAELGIVTGGELDLTVSGEPALVQDQPGGGITLVPDQSTLPTGGGLLLDHGATVTYRPAGDTPLTLTRVVLLPVSALPTGEPALAPSPAPATPA